MNIPKKLEKLMWGLLKEASRSSFIDFLGVYGITKDEYDEIKQWFQSLGLKMYL